MQKRIETFKDLLVWQEGHKLVLSVYKLTDRFPKSELFGLTSQMRRAAVSVTSNIAEGFGRRTFADRLQLYYIAQGSLTELKNQLLISRDLKYCDENEFAALEVQADQTHRLLQGFLTKTKMLSHIS